MGEVQGGRSTIWSVGLALSGTGAALALAGTTLPWAVVRQLGAPRAYYVELTDLARLAAPAAVLLVVMAAFGGAIAFGAAGAVATAVRWITVFLLDAAAVLYAFLTTYGVAGHRVLVHDPKSYDPVQIIVGESSIDTGCALFLVGAGLLASGLICSDPRLERIALGGGATRRTTAHRVLLGLALISAVASVVLAWHRLTPAPSGSTDLNPFAATPDDVAVWQTVHRAGLAGCLLLVVLAVLLPHAARWVRAAGLSLSAAVLVALAVGYALIWRGPTGVGASPAGVYATLAPTTGYGLGLLTMVLFALAFAVLPVPEPATAAESSPTDAELRSALLALAEELTNRAKP